MNVQLAMERTREAADRTLLAWIRTALSLIGFGFGFAKSRDVLADAGLLRREHPLNSVLVFSAGFVALGMLCLLGAALQHASVTRRIGQPTYQYRRTRPLATVVTGVLLVIGAYALISIVRSR